MKRGKAICGHRINVSSFIQKIFGHIELVMAHGVMQQRCVVPFFVGDKSWVLLDGLLYCRQIATRRSSDHRCVIFRLVMRWGYDAAATGKRQNNN